SPAHVHRQRGTGLRRGGTHRTRCAVGLRPVRDALWGDLAPAGILGAMSVGKLARVAAVVAACAAAAGSDTSSSNSSSSQRGALAGQSTAPPPQQMEPNVALGLWRSTFGAVKIEADNSHGGLASGNLQGIW